MARQNLFKDGHHDIMTELPISEVYRRCKLIMEKDPTATVTIRQCEGTDFPPFIAIESDEWREKEDEKGDYPRLLC